MPQQRRRSGLILGLVALGLLTGAALTASPAQAAVSGPGPYYAEPAWDQIKGAGRFLILTNWASAAVLDKETGLVWERSPQPTAETWSVARVVCANKTVGNRKGWRLPSLPELASLVDPSVNSGPLLPPGHPFTLGSTAPYWSATTSAANPAGAWDFDFVIGDAVDARDKAASHQVWCVRGGMNADAY